MISWKWTVTFAHSQLRWLVELWMSSEILLNLSCGRVNAKRAFSMGWQAPAFVRRQFTCFALLPKTKSIASMTFDLPLPFGPTTAENDCEQGSCQNNVQRVPCTRLVYYFMEGSDMLDSSV